MTEIERATADHDAHVAEHKPLPVVCAMALDHSLNRLSELTAKMGGKDERDERITQLEANVAELENTVESYGNLVDFYQEKFGQINTALAAVTEERDMLARQVAELSKYARDRIEMDAEDDATSDDVSPLLAAIEVHQKQGVR